MLHKDRSGFVTASQAHRVMAGFELELAGMTMKKPDFDKDVFSYIKKLSIKPKVGDLKKGGFKLSGSEINEIWQYLKATTPVFSEGMESVAREIAMSEFILQRDEGYKSKDMERGNEQEGTAISVLSHYIGVDFTATNDNQKFLTKGSLGVTPDGIEYEGFRVKSCAEVKNPKDTVHMKYLYLLRNNVSMLDVEAQYYWQAQCGLYITDADVYHWASYHDGFIENCNLVYVPIYANKDHIALLIKRADRVIKRANIIKKEIAKELLSMHESDLQDARDYISV